MSYQGFFVALLAVCALLALMVVLIERRRQKDAQKAYAAQRPVAPRIPARRR